jgi:hypothetical protein
LTVIVDQIINSSNVYLCSSRFWTTTSLAIFYQLPSISNSRIPPKILIRSEPHSNKPFVPIVMFMSQVDRLWNKILLQLSVHFRHP